MGYGHQVGRAIDKALYNKIDNKDFRKHSWLDPDRNFYAYKSCRPNGSAYFATLKDYVNIKFRPAQGNYTDFKVGGATDIPCMRVEEMYLIEAEATAQSNIVAARELLNEFMKYRFTDGSYDCSERTPTLKSFIEELILQNARVLGRGYHHVRPETSGYVHDPRLQGYQFSFRLSFEHRRPRSPLEFCHYPW